MSGGGAQGAARAMPVVKRLVVKIGSALVAPEGALDGAAVARLAREVFAVGGGGEREVVVVSSGAVAGGFRALGLSAPPRTIALKQAAAAVGQHRLMGAWAKGFEGLGVSVGQVLLTADDLDARARFLNARRTLLEMLARGVVPIINENDSVSFDEIKLGDNDRLSALVAGLVDADLLVILSTVPGVYEGGKKGRVVPVVTDAKAALSHVAAGTSATGVGGMGTKLLAAGMAAGWGIATVIAGGNGARVLERVLAGEEVGTLVVAGKTGGRAPARKRWLQGSARAKGEIRVDAGAAAAVVGRGASLLPSGIVSVKGEFGRGAAVLIVGPEGAGLARGLTAYSAAELRLIAGRKRAEFAGLIGGVVCDEAVHRDDMVLLI